MIDLEPTNLQRFFPDSITIYYENADDVLVRADYQQAVNDLFKPNPDRRLVNAIRNELDRASQSKKAIYVVNEGDRVLGYARALRYGLTYIEAYDSSDHWVETQTPLKELVINPQTGDPEERDL